MAFFIEDLTTRIAIVAIGIYGHVIVYSPGEGPGKFQFSSTSFKILLVEVDSSFANQIIFDSTFHLLS